MSNLEETLQSKHVGRQYSIFLFIHLLLCASFGANTVEKSAVFRFGFTQISGSLHFNIFAMPLYHRYTYLYQ